LIIASVIFILIYALIVSEKLHRTIAALLGAVVMIIFGFNSQSKAIEAIDFNTLGLLIGMMVIVGITKHTGLFEYMAVKAAKWAKGEPMRILLALSVITAIASALLDNVTTVLLIVPVTFSITHALRVKVFPFLMAEIFASNIGGTATLIGDPPNIMIGSATGLTFMDFVVNNTPVVIIIQIVTSLIFYFMYRKQLVVEPENRDKVMAMDEHELIKDYRLLRKSLAVLGLTILGFILHGFLHLEPASLAIAGATLLMAISGLNPEKVLRGVEWQVIFFFIGLFILVGTLEQLGVIKLIAAEAIELTQGNMVFTGLLVLWLSAIASAFIDNIPFVATMIPLIKNMGQLGGIDVSPLWWALSLGACLGGNGTLVGASANVVVAGLAEEHGHHISFKKFIKVAFPIMLVSIIISTVYLYVFYLR
jgi:Na+/H+ antiporter NhaD/arsenite permease-like protein